MKDEALAKLIAETGKDMAEADRARLERGVRFIAPFWRESDGIEASAGGSAPPERARGSGGDVRAAVPRYEEEFAAFVKKQFIPSGDLLDKTFARFETNFESISGHVLIIGRDLARPIQLDWGEPLPVDHPFAEYSVGAHIVDDFFKNKIAFVALLNFPPFSLKEKLELGSKWDRKAWARARLAEGFRDRIPAEVNQKVSEIFTRVDNYISDYNVFMGRVVDAELKPMFPDELKLITHWGLRDELKGQYPRPGGLARQETIYEVMKRIIDGSVPVEVINKKDSFWEPVKNELYDAQKKLAKSKGGEGAGRYAQFLETFKAVKLVDPHVPAIPTHVARRFERDRQIPEDEVEKLLVSILESPQAAEVGMLVRKRLNRDLRPFDVWYTGFKPGQNLKEDELDKAVKKKYPTLEAFKKDIPNLLKKLGFDDKTAKYLAAHIEVDPARGAGHAMGAETRTDMAHLRTRVPKDGMNYKGFNIAVHELGHCVEQVLTLNKMDFYSLRGVPNTAFTESYAFMFQQRDLELLGVAKPDPKKVAMEVLNKFWMTFEIAGVSLVDMRVWRWMYAHPDAKPEELKEAVISIAKEIWNKYYAPIFGAKDEPILAVYSHMIDAALYLPDYPIGHIINFQIEEFVKDRNLAKEMQRMVASGSVTPAQWMKNATGESISTAALLKAVEMAARK
ncbi:MAG: hypothetical protein HY897_24735 [Deltaproteobacteria bacterium]|nr:hypothetical protein [Deltaproteobacteria bacterium]